jgi:hypothetical protein
LIPTGVSNRSDAASLPDRFPADDSDGFRIRRSPPFLNILSKGKAGRQSLTQRSRFSSILESKENQDSGIIHKPPRPMAPPQTPTFLKMNFLESQGRARLTRKISLYEDFASVLKAERPALMVISSVASAIMKEQIIRRYCVFRFQNSLQSLCHTVAGFKIGIHLKRRAPGCAARLKILQIRSEKFIWRVGSKFSDIIPAF